MLKKFWYSLLSLLPDKSFMALIHITENIVSKILSLALIVVIFVSIFDLIYVLLTDLLFDEKVGFLNNTLIDIFGLFLNVLIALELLENITVYLRKHIVQLELVLITAMIAVARKIIIFNPDKYDKSSIVSLGIGILCLAGSYGIIHYVNRRKERE